MAKENVLPELKRRIKEGQTGGIFLFYGEERYLKEFYLGKLKEAIPDGGFAEFNHVFLDGKSLTFDQVDDAVESFPVMSDRKLVCIKDSGAFKAPGEEVKQYWMQRLKTIPQEVTLVFDETEVDKRSATYKAAAKAGLAVEFSYMKEYDLVNWVERAAMRAKKRITKENAQYFVSICDEGLSTLSQELDKLLNYCGEEILRSDIEKVVSKSVGVKVFELTEQMMAKDAGKALQVLNDLKTAKEPVFKLLYLLFSTFDKMLRCKLMLAEGAGFAEVAEQAGIAGFLVQKYAAGAKRFGEAYLVERLLRICEIDLAIKEGMTEDWPALERFVLDSVQHG